MVVSLDKRSGKLRRLAQAQATFRHLAALVAKGAPPEELFAAFADELGPLLPGEAVAMGRYLPGGELAPVAAWGRDAWPADPAQVLSAAGFSVGAEIALTEALTNVAKHSGASSAEVEVERRGNQLYVSVRDNGVGGASPAGGSGLVGLRDRVETLGGSLSLDSPAGQGRTSKRCSPWTRKRSGGADTAAGS